MDEEEDLQPYTEPPNADLDSWVTQKMMDMGLQLNWIQHVLNNKTYDYVMSTYLMSKRKKPKVQVHTIQVRPFRSPDLNSCSPFPPWQVHPECSRQQHEAQRTGQKVKESVGPAARPMSRNISPGCSSKSRTAYPGPSPHSRNACLRPKLKSRTATPGPSWKLRTSTSRPIPEWESRTAIPWPNLEFESRTVTPHPTQSQRPLPLVQPHSVALGNPSPATAAAAPAAPETTMEPRREPARADVWWLGVAQLYKKNKALP